MKLNKENLLNLLRLNSPTKARKLAKILSDEFGYHIDRKDVNSLLYKMERDGLARKDKDYQWFPAQLPEPPQVESLNDATISYTEEQEAIINLNPNGHLLIRGQAGSGKTTVLSAIAGKCLSAMNNGTILFLTYNSALSAYVQNTFKRTNTNDNIDVRTFHDWARDCTRELGINFSSWVDAKERREKIIDFIKDAREEMGGHRLYNLDDAPHLLGWWGEEIAWLFGQYIVRLDDYLTVKRFNRGVSVRVTEEDKRFVWDVYERYLEWLEETEKEDYDNPAGLILRSLEQSDNKLPERLRYDHVMVDEVQDFDKSWLLAVVKIPRVSLYLAGDVAQKIYRRNFSWSSVGIQVQGARSRQLNSSHRTTYEIMEVAKYLLKDNTITASEDYLAPGFPDKRGESVYRIESYSPKEAYNLGYNWVAKKFSRLQDKTIAIAVPFSRQIYPVRKALENLGVSSQNAKGRHLGSFTSGIVITTYHQLKGLEFDHVIIMGLHDAQYPSRLINNTPEEDIDETIQMVKCLLYVGMTRAKETVTLVGSTPFCRFFNEVPKDLFNFVQNNND